MKLLKILGGLVLLLVIALFVVGFFIDGIAKTAIETAGTEALGVPTRVGSCHLGLLRGTFKLEDLTIDNPEGFGDDPFLTLGEGKVAVSPGSLREPVVELPELTLDRVGLSMVQHLKGSNYGTILDNLKRYQGTSSSEEGEGTRYIIRTLRLTDVNVRVVPEPKLGLAAMDLPIGTIELKDVGSESDKGVLLADLAGIVIQAILGKASSTGKLPSVIQGALGGQLDGLKQGVEQEVKRQIDDATKGVKDRLKGLIGR